MAVPESEHLLAEAVVTERLGELPGWDRLGEAITKTYTLTEGEYHIGLEVKLARKADDGDKNGLKVRYQRRFWRWRW